MKIEPKDKCPKCGKMYAAAQARTHLLACTVQSERELAMNTDINIFPLNFEQALRYVADQLQDGHTLARELLINLNFKEGSFFALLHPSADRTKIYEFQTGGILAVNPLEDVLFQGKVYPGRKKAHSVHQLALYLKSILQPGQCCFFEDMIHHRSDPIVSEIEKHILYFHREVYLYIKEAEFSQELAKKIIHYADAQWYYMNIISESDPRCELNMTSEQLHNIALKATLIVIGAYDMEGFVVWKRFSDLE
ncbi:MAG: hypothetical protein KGR16_00050 [Verrucomicrobia bacterium]|nr:hypothetical protein [Verrucomicrobiota bacterium]